MATVGQIIFTKLTALAIALAGAWWWRSEGFGWPATIAAGILSYIFWKMAISVAIGRYQGALLRAQMDATADAFVDGQRRAKSTLESKK
jgi:hypothetical protein